MSEAKIGSIGWCDLTVEDAEPLRDFYRDVAGWSIHPVSMGEYEDYAMVAPDGTPVGGVCHSRGKNAGLPAVWLIYIVVEDLDAALAKCISLGGSVVGEKRGEGKGSFCVIRDPAGAYCALYQG